jgi:hypothetical protein
MHGFDESKWGVIGPNHHSTGEAIDAMWRVAQMDPDPSIRIIESFSQISGALDRPSARG